MRPPTAWELLLLEIGEPECKARIAVLKQRLRDSALLRLLRSIGNMF